jgi:hypothetical protein
MSKTEPVKAWKGFNADMTCRGHQYADGQTYEHSGRVSLCNSGFHAVLLPLDALSYYPAPKSMYREVELEGIAEADRGGDSKVAARKITVGASVSLAGLVKAHVEAIWAQVKRPSGKNAATTGDSAHAATTGYSAHAATTGYYAHAATTGDSAHAATTGDSAHAATTGDSANAATTGRYANAATTGYSDDVRASVSDEGAIAAVLGQGAAKGALGCWLVLTERDGDWNVLGVKAVRVDGKRVKAGVFYALRGGTVTPVDGDAA